MDSSKERVAPVFLERSSRSTRGKRYGTSWLPFLFFFLGMDLLWTGDLLMQDVSNCMDL